MRKLKIWFMIGELMIIVGIGVFRSAVVTLTGVLGALLGAIGALVTFTGVFICGETETLHKPTKLELTVKVLEEPLVNPLYNQ